MHCPQCGSTNLQKNGCRRGRQQYRCKECDRQFTEIILPRGYSEDARRICIRMYRMGLTLREIEWLTGISHSAINNWVRQEDLAKQADAATEICEEEQESSCSLMTVFRYLA